MKYIILLLTTAMLATLTSCNIVDTERVKGNGNTTSKAYAFKDFSAIELDDNMQLFIKQSPSYLVEVKTDENLQQFIIVNVVEGNKLEIKFKNNINLRPTNNIKVYVSAPALDKIDVGNASEVETDGKFSQDKKLTIDLSEASSGKFYVRVPVIDMDASEASSLIISGESRDIKAKASEASTIKAYDLKAENGDVSASEASSIQVFSSVTLKVNASEASTVRYKGSPNVTSNVREASSVSKEN